MQIKSIHLENFASYKELDFEFKDRGLVLIHGATGSGKSTLCDAVAWCLFGRTAKGGAVDEVIGWNNSDVTVGTITLDNGHRITRTRGKGKNDLWYDDKVRGKDLNDTQYQINNLLGLDVDLYLAGAYFHEFSQTAQFFTTTAKNRRSICEQIVDLSLAKQLQTKVSENKKETKANIDALDTDLKITESKISFFLAQQEKYKAQSATFEEDKAKDIEELSKDAEELRTKLMARPAGLGYLKITQFELKEAEADKCPTCNGPRKSSEVTILYNRVSEIKSKLQNLDYLERDLKKLEITIEKLKTQERHILTALPELDSAIDHRDSLGTAIVEQRTLMSDIELLSEVVDQFRSTTVKHAILQAENHTNNLLSSFFDAEIKVLFSIEDADKLNVNIQKDGNNCVYTQLSKGQRQILKLCFAVSMMKTIASANSVQLSTIFFDEALDGMDDNFKLRALSLFKSLETEYSSIFVVEHNTEFKAMCDTKYEVSLVNGNSVINAQA